jgi:hypothetical protein
MLLAIGIRDIMASGDAVLNAASLVASGMIETMQLNTNPPRFDLYLIKLSSKGRMFVNAWKNGEQKAAVNLDFDK